MEDEIKFEEKLKQKFPDLFHTNEKGELYVPCGCYCPVGWQPIVEDVLDSINSYLKHSTKSEKNPDHEFFFWFWKEIWVPIHNWLFRLFDPEKITLLERLSLKPKQRKGWVVVLPEEQKRREKLLGSRLRAKLYKIEEWFKKGKREYRSVPMPSFKLEQIKEKFGGLRIYVSCSDDYVHGQLHFASYLASKTCMFTGEPGERYNKNGWIVTASKEQIQKFESERK